MTVSTPHHSLSAGIAALGINTRNDDPRFQKFFGPHLRKDGVITQDPEKSWMFGYPGHKGGPASGMKVLGVANDDNACGNYRIKYPLMMLAHLGAEVEVRLMTAKHPLPLTSLFDAEYLLAQRMHDERGPDLLGSLTKTQGLTLVYDIDDALHSVSPKSPAYELYNLKSRQGASVLTGIHRYLENAHASVFSTRELAGYYASRTGHSHILQNGLDCSLSDRDWETQQDWRPLAEAQGVTTDSDSLLFGFSGGKTHYEDLLPMGRIIENVLRENPNTFFGIQTAPNIAFDLVVNKWRLPLDRVVYFSPVPFKEYPTSLTMFDVNLAPLENTTFNQCKSALRLLEFGAQGVPYVASRVAPFQRFHRASEEIGGFTIGPGVSWERNITTLLRDHGLRHEMGANLKKYVRERHDIQITALGLPYILQAAKLVRQGHLNAPSLTSVVDAARGVPHLVHNTTKKDPCPCGGGKKYQICTCNPAWGKG